MKHWRAIVLVCVAVFIGAYISLFFFNNNQKPIYGVSYDPDYARYLTTDAGKGFLTVINDWNFKYIRLPIHWDVVEWTRGHYDFNDIDWYVDRAGDKGVKVMLAVGQKTPRWPECHIPDWTHTLSDAEYQQAVRDYLAAVVTHYKDHPALEIWQVENEPFLDFGGCRETTRQDLAEEIALVKRLDPNHPTITSDSGELSLWTKTAQAADLFGMTMYRKVWNEIIGVWTYEFLPASLYRLRLWANNRAPEQAYVLELQAEPWLAVHINSSTPEELLQFMSKTDIVDNLAYAEKVGLPRVYLWGAEWWYWLKLKGYTEIPDFIAGLKKQP